MLELTNVINEVWRTFVIVPTWGSVMCLFCCRTHFWWNDVYIKGFKNAITDLVWHLMHSNLSVQAWWVKQLWCFIYSFKPWIISWHLVTLIVTQITLMILTCHCGQKYLMTLTLVFTPFTEKPLSKIQFVSYQTWGHHGTRVSQDHVGSRSSRSL